jgi:predicted DNA-binding transcriptional regulator
MVSKDQAIGGIIFLVCVVIAILYIVLLLGAQWMEGQGWVTWNPDTVRFWVIAVPVFIAFIAVMGIGAWIGWTMATTPPPKPIEEITSEIEEKKEEEAPEETLEQEEEKEKPKRKKKS